MGLRIRHGLWAFVAFALATSFLGVASAGTASSSASRCKIVVTGVHWSIKGAGSGTSYVLGGEGMSCTVAKPWALKLMRSKITTFGQTPTGPKGFKCHSFATPASGDKLVYSGVCLHAPGVPFFEWAPKTT